MNFGGTARIYTLTVDFSVGTNFLINITKGNTVFIFQGIRNISGIPMLVTGSGFDLTCPFPYFSKNATSSYVDIFRNNTLSQT